MIVALLANSGPSAAALSAAHYPMAWRVMYDGTVRIVPLKHIRTGRQGDPYSAALARCVCE